MSKMQTCQLYDKNTAAIASKNYKLAS